MVQRCHRLCMCLSLLVVVICTRIIFVVLLKDMYLGDRTKDHIMSVTRSSKTTSVHHHTHFESHNFEPRKHAPTRSYEAWSTETRLFTVRNYTRMKYGPVFILGVVGGNSTANSTWDHFRIYGMLDSKLYGRDTLYCCLLYGKNDQIVTVHSQTISEKRHFIQAAMWTFHVGCPNVKHAQGHTPVGLAVTLLSNGKCTEDHVTYVQPYFPVKEPEKIVIGSKLAYGNISAELIIEWIEAMKYIGVDKIVTYFLRSLNTDALNVLCLYATEGVVELYFYEPANEVTYPRVANFSIGRHSKRWNDQTAVVYDSFERASGCRYFAIIDQDEFFIPGKYRTLQEMFDHLEQVYSRPAGFKLRAQYYILSWGKSSNISDMILGSYTTREDREARFDNQKNFQIPARVALGGSSTHDVTPVDGFNMYELPAKEGYIRHFRHDCRKGNYIECMTNTAKVMDTDVADWAEGFRDRVAKVRKTVLGL